MGKWNNTFPLPIFSYLAIALCVIRWYKRSKAEIVRENLDVTHMGMKLSPEMMELVFLATFEQIDEKAAVMGEFALIIGFRSTSED
jgi:hypothetical protein